MLELAYDSPDDEEGQTALLMAQKLMVKHNLSLSDVKEAETNQNIGEIVGIWEYRMPWWKERLAGVLGGNFRCKVIRRRKRDEGITQIVFFGYDTDAELCTKVYEGALLYLDYRIKRLFPTIVPSHWRDYKKSYILGFISGLEERFKAQRASSEAFALMVQVPAEVLEEQNRRMGVLKNRVAKPSITNFDLEAYADGLIHAKESKLLSEELLNGVAW